MGKSSFEDVEDLKGERTMKNFPTDFQIALWVPSAQVFIVQLQWDKVEE